MRLRSFFFPCVFLISGFLLCVFVLHTFLSTQRNTQTHMVQHVLTFVFMHWDYVTLKVRAKVTVGCMPLLPLTYFHASTFAAAPLLRAALCTYKWCNWCGLKKCLNRVFLNSWMSSFLFVKSLGWWLFFFHVVFKCTVSLNVLYLK